jgi:hypothetical protein
VIHLNQGVILIKIKNQRERASLQEFGDIAFQNNICKVINPTMLQDDINTTELNMWPKTWMR